MKETRIWALATINRGCSHLTNDINVKTMQTCLSYLSPTFMRFVLSFTDPEDPDFTMNSKLIFQTIEQMTAAKTPSLLQLFATNAELSEKLLLGTKRCMTS